MIINMTGGGGGAALNFKVVPGLTQPGTASENTIWVKTEKIGGWYFSVTQPEGLQEWDVWFQTGTESATEFNALRKNGLQVYPLSAKQYVSGAWVDRGAKSYQNGQWEPWFDGTLYELGKKADFYTFTPEPVGNAKVTFNSDHILLSGYKGNDNIPILYIEDVDLTRYNRIELEYSEFTFVSDDSFTLRILDGSTTVTDSTASTSGSGKITIRLDGISGRKKIRMHYYVASSISTAKTVKVNKIKLYV